MQRLKAILSVFRYLVLFKKPSLSSLDYIDIIIEEKPVFLISWSAKNAYKVKLKPFNTTYWKKQVSLLLQTPPQLAFVELIVSNLWRDTKIKIELKHTKLDDKTASLLLKHFNPLSYNIQVNRKNVPRFSKKLVLSKKLKSVKTSTVLVKPAKIHLVNKFSIFINKLQYTKQ
jgi:hypothetical protein